MMHKLKSLIKNGLLVSKFQDDSKGLFAKFLYLGQNPKARIVTPFGFLNKPQDGTNSLLLSLLGNASNQLAIALMPKGETVVLNDGEFGMKVPGKSIWVIFRNDETIELKINDTTLIASEGNINVTNATINVTNGDVVADGISLKNHVHGDVATGENNTGGPV